MSYSNSALLSSGGLINTQYFTSSGSYTPSSGTTKIKVIVQGSGGAGGGASSGINKSAGSGGNAGNIIMSTISNISATTGTITINSGGAGSSGGNGNNGQNCSFVYGTNSLVANGGAGGQVGANSSNGEYVRTGDNGAPLSVISGADILFSTTIRGETGDRAIYSTTSNTIASGKGGNGLFNGAGNFKFSNGGSSAAAGFSATLGSGGGGAFQTNNSNQSGGAGGSGFVLIEEYA